MSGIIIIFMGLVLGLMTGVFSRVPNPKKVDGKIVSLDFQRGNGGGNLYIANVEYNVDGVTYNVKSKYASSTDFRKNQKVRVVFDETKPECAIIRPSIKIYVIMLGFFIAGIIVCYKELFSKTI